MRMRLALTLSAYRGGLFGSAGPPPPPPETETAILTDNTGAVLIDKSGAAYSGQKEV